MARADFRVEETAKGTVLSLSGDWIATGVGRSGRRLQTALEDRRVTRLDLSELGRFDTTGALALVQTGRLDFPADAWKARPEAGRIFALVQRLERQSAPPPRRAHPTLRTLSRIGHGVYDFGAEATLSLAFLGRLIAATGTALKHPGRIRWAAWVSQAERAGLDALPIVMVTNFFIGAVVAFLGVDILSQFGAGVFAVQMIGFAVLREFAVVITAVLLAGRSASAFAAEVGSMRMNQEIDAMQVMGVNAFQALVIPRLAALLIMLPLLTFAAMMAGLFGGLLVTWSSLNLGPAFFLQRLQDDPNMFQQALVGLSKAPVFALVIAAIGCRQGMAVAGDVESLGRRVTAAVVQAIFAIIFLDAVFALIYLELNL